MARPIKQGLDYFPFNVDFFDDDKIAFVSARFQEKGEMIAIKLLCKIYKDTGYYYQWGEDEAVLFAKRVVGDSSRHTLVNDVVQELIKRDFFDKSIFDRFKILTSRGIQYRYEKICKDANRVCEIDQRMSLLGQNPRFPRTKPPVSSGESTQRKEKEIKLKEIKREEEKKPLTLFEIFLTENQILNSQNLEFLSSEMWFDTKAMQLASQSATLIEKAKDFLVDLRHRDQIEGKTLPDLRSHFISWFKLKREAEKPEKPVTYRIPKYTVL